MLFVGQDQIPIQQERWPVSWCQCILLPSLSLRVAIIHSAQTSLLFCCLSSKGTCKQGTQMRKGTSSEPFVDCLMAMSGGLYKRKGEDVRWVGWMHWHLALLPVMRQEIDKNGKAHQWPHLCQSPSAYEFNYLGSGGGGAGRENENV